MKCCYCSKGVLAEDPITVSGIGPAHRSCYERSLIEERVFKNLNLRSMPEGELNELFDMVKMEMNARKAEHTAIDVWDDVTLFG